MKLAGRILTTFILVLLATQVLPVSQILSEAKAFAQSVDTAWVRGSSESRNVGDSAWFLAVHGSDKGSVSRESYENRPSEGHTTIRYAGLTSQPVSQSHLSNPPQLTCPDNEWAHAPFTFVSSDFSVTDPDGDPVDVTLCGVTPPPTYQPTIVDSHVEWQTSCDDLGPHEFTICLLATDTTGAKDTCYFDVIVVNYPPDLTCPENGILYATQTFVSTNFTITDDDSARVYIADVNPPPTNDPIIVGNHVEWITTINDSGNYIFVLQVVDSCLTFSECEFAVNVVNPPPDPLLFAPAVKYGTGGHVSPFCADLDGDGDLDIATARWESWDVSILKNNGDGTFQTNGDYDVGEFPVDIFCADLDRDGDLDLAVANAGEWPNPPGSTVSILKNDGDGTFQTKDDYGVGQRPRSISCGDLDADSDVDLVVANEESGNVSILKNNGDGTFQPAVNYDMGEFSFPQSVFCADLDGDSDLDLAVATIGPDSVFILKNSGNGSFQAKVGYYAGTYPCVVFCADLDSDSDLDLAVSWWNEFDSSGVAILKNNGNATFQDKVDYAPSGAPFCADIDGDLDLDLALGNNDAVSILANNGNATFQDKVDYFPGCNYGGSLFCADLDGDFDLDLAVACDNGVSILKNLTQVAANQPPWSFSLLTPTDGDTTFPGTAFLWQTAYDPNFGDQIRYDLHVSTDPGFDPGFTVVYDSLPLSALTDTLEMNTYYWKVRAYDNWDAEEWSTETWSFVVYPLSAPDTLWILSSGPVDLIVTDPVGDSIWVDSSTIQDATYDTALYIDSVTIPHPYVGEYQIKVIREEGAPEDSTYDLGIRINGSAVDLLADDEPLPPPDGCSDYSYETLPHLKGDVNGDDQINSADVVFLINYLFKSGPAPDPLELGYVNCNDDVINSADVIYLIDYLFKGGPAPCS